MTLSDVVLFVVFTILFKLALNYYMRTRSAMGEFILWLMASCFGMFLLFIIMMLVIFRPVVE